MDNSWSILEKPCRWARSSSWREALMSLHVEPREQVPAGKPGELLQPDGDSFLRNLRLLWRNLHAAVFRTGKATSDRARTQKVFNNFLLHVHSTRVHARSLKFTTTLGLGIAALASFLIAAATGILLMIYYTPSTELAYQSVKEIHYTVPTGRFIRNLHRWSAHVMVITVILHAMRVFFTSSYKNPREFNWLVGLA